MSIALSNLLQNSELHRNALLKALDKAYVAQNISVEGIDQLVGNITAGAFIAFLDEKIPSESKESTKALNNTIKCKNYIMPWDKQWFIFECDTNVYVVKTANGSFVYEKKSNGSKSI